MKSIQEIRARWEQEHRLQMEMRERMELWEMYNGAQGDEGWVGAVLIGVGLVVLVLSVVMAVVGAV